MKNNISKEQIKKQDISDTKANSVNNGVLFAFFLRLAFVVALIVGSRVFFGPISRARGRVDVLTSISMMLLLILLMERFAPRILRRILLFSTGLLLLFFHLLSGLYYRFFNCPVPFDIVRQWQDSFVVGGYGVKLMSIPEFMIVIILPLFLLVWILRKPFRSKPLIFIILLVIITVGWTNRLNRKMYRSVNSMAVLPDFIHKTAYFYCKLGFQKARYQKIIQDIDNSIPRNVPGYKTVKGKGITLEPIEPVQKNMPLKYNIILILMESVRAYECGFLGANPSFTPKLDELTKNARVYTNFYSNSSQTVRAEIGCLCSIYPNPLGSPTYLVNPNLNLISFPEIISELGYDTLWFSGYTADFHNKRAFLSRHGIKKIIDRDILPEPKTPIIGWGMNDIELFGYVWDILKESNMPFFAQITTLSNHCEKSKYPTEAETPAVATGESVSYQRYLNGIYYTDYAVSEFVKKVRNSELAKNTIIIITGDHGLWMFPSDITDPLQKLEIYFRVPLCIWGPPELIELGQDSTLGSHVDIPPTLMSMLNIYRRNTFLGQSLSNHDILNEQRYVATFLGSIPHLKVGNVFTLSKFRLQKEVKNIGKYAKASDEWLRSEKHLDFLMVEGDLLHGCFNAQPFGDKNNKIIFSKRLDDITFLTAYGIYFDAFEGLNR